MTPTLTIKVDYTVADVAPGWGPLTFEDTFDGATVDRSKWGIRDGYKDAQDHSVMKPGNVLVRDGNLVIQTVKEPTGTAGRDWTSGYAETTGKFSQRYGRWEARIKCLPPMHSRGIWSAFWLRDDKGGGEIDILEAVGTPCAHPTVYKNDGGNVSTTFYKQTGIGTIGVDRTENTVYRIPTQPYYGFHTYACEWTPDGVATFCDGVKQLEVVAGTQLGDAILAGFSSKANIRLNTFVGTNWAGFPDADTFSPSELIFDYVRVWSMP